MNCITLVGRAGRDPEVRYFESGTMVANLTLAVNRRKDEDPDWFNLEIWGKQAQVAADYVRKGSLIGVVGSIRIEKWADRSTGEQRSKPVVRVDNLQLLSSKRDNEQSDSFATPPAAPTQQRPAAAPTARPAAAAPAWNTSGPPSDEEVPF